MSLEVQRQTLYLAEDQAASQMFCVSSEVMHGYVTNRNMLAYAGEVTDGDIVLDLVARAQTYEWGRMIVADLPRMITLGGLFVYNEKLVIDQSKQQPFKERGWFNEAITHRKRLTPRPLSGFKILENSRQVTLIPVVESVST